MKYIFFYLLWIVLLIFTIVRHIALLLWSVELNPKIGVENNEWLYMSDQWKDLFELLPYHPERL